jgi:uncharacterized protein YbgA (DUF1722 family)/uncharacterized protein YbbK (DUF523 family)
MDSDGKGTPASEIRIGVSACLLGAKVRFDGQHKLHQWVTGTLGQFVTFVPVCPEMDIGLGTPRESIRIEREGERDRLVAPKSGADHTAAMERYSRAKCHDLAPISLSGYILKKDSPTCGMERVRVYGGAGMAQRTGRGFFARTLMERFPLLPVEEEGRLNDPWLRENFLERIFAYHRVRTLFGPTWTVGDLVAFHTREKFLLLAHEPKGYTALGKLVASAKGRPRPALAAEYEGQFMSSLAKVATVKKHCNVLQHLAGYFKREITAEDRQELEGVIDDYRASLVPLVVPLTLIRHFVRRYGAPYLAGQKYLEPSPKELMLRNHV